MPRLAMTAMTAALATLAMPAFTVPPISGASSRETRRPAAGRLDGLWRTDGYGTIVSIAGGRLSTYDTTAVSCTPGDLAGIRTGGTGAGGTVRFGTRGVPEIAVTPYGDGARLRLYGSPGHRTLRRIAALPAACTRPVPGDAATAFEVFWRTFQENYPFFAAKGVDWRAVHDRERPRVGRDPLFEILCDMVTPLGDRHTGVQIDQDHVCIGSRPGTRHPSAALRRRVNDTERPHLGRHVHSMSDDLITYARLPGRIGYLRLEAFDEYAEQDTYLAQRAVLDRVLARVFASPMKGLIVDVRYNLGGYDDLGLRIASRLTDRPYLAYAKRTWTGTGFTPRQPILVRPAAGRRFTGPVAVLTSDLTVSAGETFAQALLGRSPRPTLVGGATQGVFSDTMDRSLPGGGRFLLPDEQFLTGDGRSFDGRGVPPDVRTPVFTDDELDHGRDSALEQALLRLRY